MTVIIAGSSQYSATGSSPVVTIGNFDGVHLGHQHLLSRTLYHAEKRNAPSCVFTFEPSPRTLLSPDSKVLRISPWTEKIRMIGNMGIDHIILERFTHSFSMHPPEWFVDEILIKRLSAQALVVGYDFRFGKNRKGDVDFLKERAPDLFVEQVNAHQLGDVTISSSAIRQLIMDGQVEKAISYLGRCHQISGVVIEGAGRGRQLGFPTANLLPSTSLLPGAGVYAAFARVDHQEWRISMVNIGSRPTFDGGNMSIEAHLLDADFNMYGSEMQLMFVGRLRDERRFESTEALRLQLVEDRKGTLSLLERVDLQDCLGLCSRPKNL